MDRDALLEHVRTLRASARSPIVVGVSGHCGSGKSTLARALVDHMPGAVRIRGDDFLDPTRSHRRSTDWDGVERLRLGSEVLEPHRAGRTGSFRRFDWSTRALGRPEPLPVTDVLVVDLIGLFHPEVRSFLDLTVWCDVDLDEAARRGMARDHELGRAHDDLWRDVWIPNDRAFAERFGPRDSADVRYRSRGRPSTPGNG
ncbi:uridine kinase [Curtobacterium sp. MCBD17_021]|uniref:uridine kinase family protein n=1 Tax=Curtobacterium sp. MCBD17_021 TaxID=2175665 RepID=UPI000DA89D4F|nr:zeta toxin family protein [Curtobacterium sp. MCBD17_021]PZE69836.1 phosphoglycerate transporter [Curtobacterium sp. MCBD17_021]